MRNLNQQRTWVPCLGLPPERFWSWRPSWWSLPGCFPSTVGSRAILERAYLDNAELRGASLRDADLTGCSLRNADVRGADLRGAIFDKTDLSNVLADQIVSSEIASRLPTIVLGGRLGTGRIAWGCYAARSPGPKCPRVVRAAQRQMSVQGCPQRGWEA